MRLDFWLAWRLLRSGKVARGGPVILSFVGLVTGVASLIVSMAVVSGFESTLENSISDVTGHVMVARRGQIRSEEQIDLESRLRKMEPSMREAAQFLRFEALLARAGRVHGVLVMGVEDQRRDAVLKLAPRLLEGSLQIDSNAEPPRAWVGKGLAALFGLKPGSIFRIVLPVADAYNTEKFQRRVGEFQVAGILDLGRYEWNERSILTSLQSVQKLADVGERPHGLLLRYENAQSARGASYRLAEKLGPAYYVSDWRETNEYLFEAIRLEKPVIFFVVLVIVIVAAFNVASTLFISVLRQTPEISLLRSLGLPQSSVLRIVTFQGLLIGVVGCILGVLFGLLLCAAFAWLQNYFILIPGSVYKLEGIHIQLRFSDVFAVILATLTICCAAAFAPARRASRLSPVEGIRGG